MELSEKHFYYWKHSVCCRCGHCLAQAYIKQHTLESYFLISNVGLTGYQTVCTEGYIWILIHILMWKSCPLFVTSSHLKYFLWHVFVSFKVKPRTVTLVSFSTERLLPDESLNLPDSLPLLPQLPGGWGGKDNDDDGGGLLLTWNRQ